jgi:hypothetical protein
MPAIVVICFRCGKLNPVEYDYCTRCGERFPASPLPPGCLARIGSILQILNPLNWGPPPSLSVPRCPHCNEEFEPKDRYCGYCGKRFLAPRRIPINTRAGCRMSISAIIAFGFGFLIAPVFFHPDSPEHAESACLAIGFVFALGSMVTFGVPSGVHRLGIAIIKAIFGMLLGFVFPFLLSMDEDRHPMLILCTFIATFIGIQGFVNPPKKKKESG